MDIEDLLFVGFMILSLTEIFLISAAAVLLGVPVWLVFSIVLGGSLFIIGYNRI